MECLKGGEVKQEVDGAASSLVARLSTSVAFEVWTTRRIN